MGTTGGFPIDLVLFGMIAAFLVLRLRSILGKRTGYERPPQAYQPPPGAARGPVVEGKAEEVPARTSQILPDPNSPAGQALLAMQQVDRSFTPDGFLNGARQAFGMIVAAFAGGDRGTLRNLLSDDTYAAFDSAISGREQAGHAQRTEIKSVDTMAIEAASLNGSVANITVRFVSDQVNLTVDANQNPVSGTDAVTEITDLWSFERDLSKPDPVWRLISARSA